MTGWLVIILLPGRDWFRYEHECGGVTCHCLALAAENRAQAQES